MPQNENDLNVTDKPHYNSLPLQEAPLADADMAPISDPSVIIPSNSSCPASPSEVATERSAAQAASTTRSSRRRRTVPSKTVAFLNPPKKAIAKKPKAVGAA